MHPFWSLLFGREAPVEIEIGAGDGAHLETAAARRPHASFLAIESSPSKARRLAERVARIADPRVRMLRADAVCVVRTLVPAASVAAYHVYFPDPWPKRRHAKRRLFDDAMVAALARTLIPGGRLLIATDVVGYGRLIRAAILDHPAFEEVAIDEQHGGRATAFARKYRARGRDPYVAAFARRATSEPTAG